MSRHSKFLARILTGKSDTNVEFRELCTLLTRLGFADRVRGSHHIFTKPGVEEILNLQSKGGKAKAYQVRQVREIIVKYHLADD